MKGTWVGWKIVAIYRAGNNLLVPPHAASRKTPCLVSPFSPRGEYQRFEQIGASLLVRGDHP